MGAWAINKGRAEVVKYGWGMRKDIGWWLGTRLAVQSDCRTGVRRLGQGETVYIAEVEHFGCLQIRGVDLGWWMKDWNARSFCVKEIKELRSQNIQPVSSLWQRRLDVVWILKRVFNLHLFKSMLCRAQIKVNKAGWHWLQKRHSDEKEQGAPKENHI